jgi:hypothetical protein
MWDVFSSLGETLYGPDQWLMRNAPTPEQLAGSAVAAGVPPPPIPPSGNVGPMYDPFSPQMTMPPPQPQPQAPQPSVSPTLAATTPMPKPRPAEAPQAPDEASSSGEGYNKDLSMTDRFLSTLKGVKAPVAPTPQRVGTPAAPRTTPIKGGDLLALLQILQGGADQNAGLKLPNTLGQALR